VASVKVPYVVGLLQYNSSKSTNLRSIWKALSFMAFPAVV
jgi:hypothetical protein